jgi:hypothetical protein
VKLEVKTSWKFQCQLENGTMEVVDSVVC